MKNFKIGCTKGKPGCNIKFYIGCGGNGSGCNLPSFGGKRKNKKYLIIGVKNENY